MFFPGLKAWCCTCVVVGKNHHRIARGNDQEYSTCNGWCIGWAALMACGGCGWILQMIDRGDMRMKYGMYPTRAKRIIFANSLELDLEGSGFGECCTAFWCGCCEAAQTAKELEYEQLSQNGAPNGYIPQEKMNAVPQAPQQQHYQ